MADSSSMKRTAGSFVSQTGGKKRTGALLAILILFACCAASFYVYMNTMQTMRDRNDGFLSEIPEPDTESLSEAKELETTGGEYVSMGRATSMVMQTALLAEISGKYPVAQPAALIPPVVETAEGMTGDGAEEPVLEDVPEEFEPDPPQLTVIAIMISGQDKIAMVDILGEETGMVIRQGTKFSGGEARITKIDEKGVTFTWMGNSYTVVM
ncbi:hypothetical protein LJC31_00085 [Synergistaceae bacterium OttesenSCG-928-I11]|nr:hypothetical protein [Synergistaceae bacterium OttesenSCG-928-I11]